MSRWTRVRRSRQLVNAYIAVQRNDRSGPLSVAGLISNLGRLNSVPINQRNPSNDNNDVPQAANQLESDNERIHQPPVDQITNRIEIGEPPDIPLDIVQDVPDLGRNASPHPSLNIGAADLRAPSNAFSSSDSDVDESAFNSSTYNTYTDFEGDSGSEVSEEESFTSEHPHDSDPSDPESAGVDGDLSTPPASDEDDDSGRPIMNLNHEHLDETMRFIEEAKVREAVALSVTKAIRYCFSHEALIADLSSLDVLHRNSIMPSYRKKLWKLLGFDKSALTCHVYCKSCKVHIGVRQSSIRNYTCPVCGQCKSTARASIFITLNLRRQFKHFLEQPGMTNLLRYRETREHPPEGIMADILDGAAYKRLQQPGNVLSNQYCYSYTFNTDGFKIANTSRLGAWPIYLTVNELPPQLRRKHMILAAVWTDSTEPDMNLYLKPFVEEANLLARTGVSWRNEDGHLITSRLIPTVMTVDIPARSLILNMSHFSSDFGCTFCVYNGISYDEFGNYLGTRRYPVERVPRPRRTHEELWAQMQEALRTSHPVLGAKGPSEIMNLDPPWNVQDCVVVDPGHNKYLGAVKQHMKVLTSGRNQYQPFYVGSPDCVTAIDRRLRLAKRPSLIGRGPRPFSERKQWTAAEWRSWILYWALPCLTGILPEPYLSHLGLLSHACFLLSTQDISEADINQAQQLLDQYCWRAQQLFGLTYMTYNLHLLKCHTCEDVRNWGPLWSFSTLDFETLNGEMKKFVKGPTDAAQQIVMRYQMSRFIREVCFRPDIPLRTKLWIEVQMGKKSDVQQGILVGSLKLKGRGVERQPNALEQAALLGRGIYNVFNMWTYVGAYIGGTLYLTRREGVAQKVDDSVLFYQDGEIGLLLCAVWFTDRRGDRQSGLFVKRYEQHHHLCAPHVINCSPTDVIDFITADEVQRPAVLTRVGYRHFVAPLTNLVELH